MCSVTLSEIRNKVRQSSKNNFFVVTIHVIKSSVVIFVILIRTKSRSLDDEIGGENKDAEVSLSQ